MGQALVADVCTVGWLYKMYVTHASELQLHNDYYDKFNACKHLTLYTIILAFICDIYSVIKCHAIVLI